MPSIEWDDSLRCVTVAGHVPPRRNNFGQLEFEFPLHVVGDVTLGAVRDVLRQALMAIHRGGGRAPGHTLTRSSHPLQPGLSIFWHSGRL